MSSVVITRRVSVPDALRLSRYQKIPEFGPRLLFFSGGTAVNGLARELKQYTHNSIHLVASFDSGGSSAELRKQFSMPAVGDLRSRLMALADDTVLGHQSIVDLFSLRLDKQADKASAINTLSALADGKSPLVAAVPEPMKHIIQGYLGVFLAAMPTNFDLRGASIGNLILAGGYLSLERNLDQIIYLFSQLVNTKGVVSPISDQDYHLYAQLADGTEILGQHRFTGKECAPVTCRITHIGFSASANTIAPINVELGDNNQRLISEADLICYPMGSFFSSLIANVMLHGVANAIAENPCPKLYIPNLGDDPEQSGLSLIESIKVLIITLQQQVDHAVAVSDLLNIVFLPEAYPLDIAAPDIAELIAQGVQFLRLPLVDTNNAQRYDDCALAQALLSFV